MNASRVFTATNLGFREQLRRPLLLVLLVGLPFFFITRAIARTVQTPRKVILPGGDVVVTTMRDVHGASMATITVAFLTALIGVFVVQSALKADRRLVVAGFRPAEAIIPRLLVLGAATATIVTVSLVVTAISFEPRNWSGFIAGSLLAGLIYGALGALAGTVFSYLAATYLVLFAVMLDIGIAQDPMFGTGKPAGWAAALPGYGPGRIVVDSAFSSVFHVWDAVAIALAWTAVLAGAVYFVLNRAVGTRNHALGGDRVGR